MPSRCDSSRGIPTKIDTEAAVKLGWIGIHEEGIPALDAVCSAGYQVQGVMTLAKAAAADRAGSACYADICRPYHLPVYEVNHVNEDSSLEILRAWDCDVLVVLGWGQILSPEVLRLPKIGAVGAHASLLPRNPGSAPVSRAIINGESQTGNSLIWLMPDVDAGDVIDQRSFPISSYDTCRTIYDAVAESNRDMLLSVLPKLADGIIPGVAQPGSDAAFLPRRGPRDGKIDWQNSTSQIYNLIRAVTRPYPGATTEFRGQTFKIWTAAAMPEFNTGLAPGTVIGPVRSPRAESCGQLIATSDGAILILEAENGVGRVIGGRELCEQNWTQRGVANAA